MHSRKTDDRITFLSNRQARFRFACKACGRCCSEYRILLSPYDIIRLRKATGCSTGELIRRGTVQIFRAPAQDIFGFAPIADMLEVFGLSRTADVPVALLRFRGENNGRNTCEFLSTAREGKRLCLIYEHRPGMCRLHPLGCVTVRNRRQWFFRQPLCRTGREAEWMTVEEWIRVSRLKPFLAANVRYMQWIRQLLEERNTLRDISENQWRTLEHILYDFDSIDPEIDHLSLDGIIRSGQEGKTKKRGSIPVINEMFQRWLAHGKFTSGAGGRDACRSDG